MEVKKGREQESVGYKETYKKTGDVNTEQILGDV